MEKIKQKIHPCKSCAKSGTCPALRVLSTSVGGAFEVLARVHATVVRCDVRDLEVGKDGYVSRCKLTCFDYLSDDPQASAYPMDWRRMLPYKDRK